MHSLHALIEDYLTRALVTVHRSIAVVAIKYPLDICMAAVQLRRLAYACVRTYICGLAWPAWRQLGICDL